MSWLKEVEGSRIPEAEGALDPPVLPSTLVPEHMYTHPLFVWDQTDPHVPIIEAVGKFELFGGTEPDKTPLQPTE